jgi:HD-GYP domain-containing protein (c-di-GMP phosphodiesterase class II)
MARDFANLRDFETGAHLERMAKNSRIIAKHISGKYGLSDEFIEHVYLFAPLHDIGKIGIPDAVLLKPGKLDDDEKRIMQTHVGKGVEIVEKILHDFNLEKSKDSTIMRNIVAYHHEQMDGSGYPYGLKGSAIPIEARIITVADILDALVSTRPYKKKWPMDEAINELKRMSASGKLDADCVEAVEKNIDEIVSVVEDHQDEIA